VQIELALDWDLVRLFVHSGYPINRCRSQRTSP
jgi:hypothetical protein